MRVTDTDPMATILLVEDNDDIREMMGVALQLNGHEVWPASNGQAALEILRNRRPPSLILLDLMMPVMNGWEFRIALDADPLLSNIPVVVVSALGSELAGLLSNAEVVPKPVDIDRLLHVVCECCNGSGRRSTGTGTTRSM
jgi:CheY-like chemotaxis protein